MTFIRRFLPSITFLCSFEASARHLSFTAAARELNLTQSAISRHIRMLEERLGSSLFVRDRQTVRLTRAGELYAVEIRSALALISQATLGFRACPSGRSINVGIDATLGARWLLPALKDFHVLHPDVDINLISDMRQDNIDVCIRLPTDDDHEMVVREILSVPIIPVCASTLLARFRVKQVEDMGEAPLLHFTSRPDMWERWFENQGFYPEAVNGTLFDQYMTIIGAAMSGIGIALLPRVLVLDELENGSLSEIKCKNNITENYHIIYRKNSEKHVLIRDFSSYLENMN
ncbi:LysR substrate-binding domain-containing protein [Komagataeibacter xylinus]|uniref:LysR substrate-binding domain-containing protein n=1 Tax=Komagataeibacter xylinus TaxID=28448 RepID=UPI00280B5AD4|nr:LysR substrate-binding domain-containing protein [Komagataeibacter xylinus]